MIARHIHFDRSALNDTDASDLIDVSHTAARKETGFEYDLFVSKRLYHELIAWDTADTKKQKIEQDEAVRLWNVLQMLKVRMMKPTFGCNNYFYNLYAIARDGESVHAKKHELKAVVKASAIQGVHIVISFLGETMHD